MPLRLGARRNEPRPVGPCVAGRAVFAVSAGAGPAGGALHRGPSEHWSAGIAGTQGVAVPLERQARDRLPRFDGGGQL